MKKYKKTPRVSDITYAMPVANALTTYCRTTIIQLIDSGAIDLVIRNFHYEGENVNGIMGINHFSKLMNQPHDIVIPPCRPHCECAHEEMISFDQAKVELL